jgi:hypothetical protein
MPGNLAMPHITLSSKTYFENCVEGSKTPQLLHFACLQNQHHMDNDKVFPVLAVVKFPGIMAAAAYEYLGN